MARITPDSVIARHAELAEGETLQAEFRADRGTYWRAHLIMAAALGLVAGLFLLWQGNPYPVAGPVGAILAIGARAAFLASEALTDLWRLTDRRLLGPGGRSIPLAQIKAANPFLGAVQIVTLSGDKHLMKYLATPSAVAQQVLTAAGKASPHG